MAAASSPAAPPASEQVTISTDVVRATIDSVGATLARVELLKQFDPFDRSKSVVLLDRSASRLYLAQTGLVPPAGGTGLPNHHTPMHALAGERSLAPGKNELTVAFESEPVGGVKLVKTYTFRRGDYVIDVQHRIVNAAPTPINPRLYLQLVRDGNDPPGGSSLYFTFTGPAIYTESSHYKKIDFKSIEKRGPGDKPDHETTGASGWVGDGAALLPGGVAGRQARRARAGARVLHRQGRHQHVFGRRARADGRDRSRRDQDVRRQALRRPAGGRPARRRSRPGSSSSRTTAGSRSSPSRCSGC